MNRMLAVPAGCCLIAYAAAFWVFNSAESATTRRPLPSAFAVPEITPSPASNAVDTESSSARARSAATPHLLTVAEAEKVLHLIEAEYLRPYQEWQQSPHRIYSRAMPKPAPSASFDHSIAQGRMGEHHLLLTMTLSVGGNKTTFPCAIDRVTGEVGVFADGRWASAAQWVAAAPRVLR